VGGSDLSSKASLAISLPNLTSADMPSTATVGRFAFCARAQSGARGSRVVQAAETSLGKAETGPVGCLWHYGSGRALHLGAEDDIDRPRRLRARDIQDAHSAIALDDPPASSKFLELRSPVCRPRISFAT